MIAPDARLSPLANRACAFFIGPRKTGTSWINLYLGQRGDVLTPRTTKETFFFDRYFDRGAAWYLDQFSPQGQAGDGTLVECAPSYAGNAAAMERIAAEIPDARLIITLREPVARVQSHWRHMIRYGADETSLQEHMQEGAEIWADAQYGSILDRAVSLVGAERVSVVLYEDLRADPDAFARSVSAAIGLEYRAPDKSASQTVMNVAQKPRSRALSALASRGSEALRNARLHGVVRAARKAGLRNLLERPYEKSESAIDAETRAAIRAQLSEQIDVLVQTLKAHPDVVPLGRCDEVLSQIADWR
ncbi:MAG: sulfotransferase [Pseudomonadota bacterium]